MKKIYFLLTTFFILVSLSVHAGGACSPVATNTTCATATNLTVGAACINSTTCGGSAELTPSCLFAGSECSWYSFTATAANMIVTVDVTTTDGCNISSNVYSRTGACAGLTQISCLAAAPLDDIHVLSGLTIGNVYYIQVCYPIGGPCGATGKATFCIRVSLPDPICNTCAAPCGTAQGFAAPPTAATVVAGCTTSQFAPPLVSGSVNTFCYDFRATATSVDFNVIITSNCGAGNVSAFSWSLYNSTCGGSIQTGTLASLTFTPVVVGNDYTFCYTFTVPNPPPSGCTHSQHCPYFVGATVLPITLTSFEAQVVDNKFVNLDWVTETEINNDYFTVERSNDLEIFEVIDIVKSKNGNSNITQSYKMMDSNPIKGKSYYRLKQTDYDGTYKYSMPISISLKSTYEDISVFPNPVTGNGYLTFNSLNDDEQTVVIYDVSGRLVYHKQYNIIKGDNKLVLETSQLTKGMYFIKIADGTDGVNIKFIKE